MCVFWFVFFFGLFVLRRGKGGGGNVQRIELDYLHQTRCINTSKNCNFKFILLNFDFGVFELNLFFLHSSRPTLKVNFMASIRFNSIFDEYFHRIPICFFVFFGPSLFFLFIYY